MNKKVISIALALGIAASATACTTDTGAKPSSVPAASSAASPAANNAPIRILTNVSFGKDDAEMKLFQEALSKAVGVSVVLEKPASDYDNVMLQKLKSGEQYDLVYCTQEQMANLSKQGAIADLTSKIQKSTILSDTSVIPTSEWDLIKLDGKLFAGFNKKEVHKLVTVNNAIAKRAEVDVTKIDPTLDGYYAFYKALKAKITDPGFYPTNIAIAKYHDFQPYFAATNTNVNLVTVGGKVTAPITDAQAAPVWDWLTKLYSEGLLDPESLTDTTAELRNKFQSGKSGAVSDWAAWVGLYNKNAADNYPAKMEATPIGGIKTPDGKYLLNRGNASLWVVPVNAKNPDAAFKMIEFFATQDGGNLLSAGLPGNDYNVVDGKFVLTDAGKKHGGDHGAPVPISAKFVNPLPWNPGFEAAMKFLPSAVPSEVSADRPAFEAIIQKYAVQILSKQVDTATGQKKMKEDLIKANILK